MFKMRQGTFQLLAGKDYGKLFTPVTNGEVDLSQVVSDETADASQDPISLGVLKAPADYGADIAVGPTQPLGVHMNGGGGVGGGVNTPGEAAGDPDSSTAQVSCQVAS